MTVFDDDADHSLPSWQPYAASGPGGNARGARGSRGATARGRGRGRGGRGQGRGRGRGAGASTRVARPLCPVCQRGFTVFMYKIFNGL